MFSISCAFGVCLPLSCVLAFTISVKASDVEPPTLLSASFSPGTVNVAHADQTVYVDLHLKDNQSGVQSASLFIQSPSGAHTVGSPFCSLLSGTVLDGVWRIRVTVKKYAENGEWKLISAMVTDTVGNFRGFDAAFFRGIDAPTLTVMESTGNMKPELTNPGNQVSKEGDSVSLQLIAADPDGNPLTFSAAGLPPGVSVNSATGLVQGVLNSVGSFAVTFTVKDGTAQASVQISWLVKPKLARILYPQLALGGGFDIVLLLHNKSDTIWSGRGWLRGSSWPLLDWTVNGEQRQGVNYFAIRLPAGQTQKLTLRSAQSVGATGWLEISPDSSESIEDLVTSFFYNYSVNGVLIDSTGVLPAEPVRKIAFPVEKSGRISTAIAIRRAEGSGSSAAFSARLLSATGALVGEAHGDESFLRAQFFDELFKSAYESMVGAVLIESAAPFYALVVRFESTEHGFEVTSIPATGLE